MKCNFQEIPELIKLASKLDIDRVKGHHLWVHNKEIESESLKQDRESIQNWNEIVSKCFQIQKEFPRKNGKFVVLENFFYLTEKETQEVPKNYECPFLGKELWISAERKISPCCAPDELRTTLGDFGNIQTQTLEDVLNSTQYQNLQRDYREIKVCKTCNMRKPITYT